MERKTGSWTNSQKKNEKKHKTRNEGGNGHREEDANTKFMKNKESVFKRAHFVWRNL